MNVTITHGLKDASAGRESDGNGAESRTWEHGSYWWWDFAYLWTYLWA
jgi:hypothetical protein